MVSFSFSQLALREQWVLVLGGLVLLVMVGYFMGWVPLMEQRSQLQIQLVAEQATLEWMQQAVRDIQELRRSQLPVPNLETGQSLLGILDQESQQGVLKSVEKRLEPQGDQAVQVHFVSVDFEELIKWLAMLYHQYQIQVTVFKAEKLSVSGKVKVQLQLSWPGT